MHILDLCSRYTGVDFSERGLQLARSSFADVRIPHEFRKADICALPFNDGAFDAVYSSNVIYHIDDAAAQDAALAEMGRMVRPGGVVVLVAANPYPLAFPRQLARGLVRDAPIIGSVLNRFRLKPPLPYRPMPIGWMRRRLARFGPVEVVTSALPTTYFNQNVTEFNGLGKLQWKAIRWMDVRHPRLSAYLGNYVMLTFTKNAAKCAANQDAGEAGLELRIKEICQTRVRYGYRRVHVLLRREGWPINQKKTRRSIASWACNYATRRRNGGSRPSCVRIDAMPRGRTRPGPWILCMINLRLSGSCAC